MGESKVVSIAVSYIEVYFYDIGPTLLSYF